MKSSTAYHKYFSGLIEKGTPFTAFLVRLGNADGVYTTILHAEDNERAVIWAGYLAGKHAEEVTSAQASGRTLTEQEAAFVAWAHTANEPVKVVPLSMWDGRFGDELPIFAPTGMAAWSLSQSKTVAGRVSYLEVSPATLKMVCPVCGAQYSANWPDYSFHTYRDGLDHVFTCDCDERAPVMLFVDALGNVVDDTGALRAMRDYYRENSL